MVQTAAGCGIAGNLISDSTSDVENYLEGSGVDGTSRFVKSSHGLAREVLAADWGNNTSRHMQQSFETFTTMLRKTIEEAT